MRAHDLLRIDHGALPAGAPEWVGVALEAAPWVVVRRAIASPGRIAAGVRGPARSQRWALEVPAGSVVEVRTPESLRPDGPTGDPRPAFAALDAFPPALASTVGEVAWGPTGSVGFELATGVRTVTGPSDLDVVVRGPLPRAVLTDLHHALVAGPCRVDVQVELADAQHAAVSLAELATGVATVLARTAVGPQLVPAPR